jgi:hypothetical protein
VQTEKWRILAVNGKFATKVKRKWPPFKAAISFFASAF